MLRNVSIRQKGLLVLALPLVLILALLGTLYRLGQSLDEAVAWSARSQDALRTIEEISADLVAMHGENLQLALLGNSESAFRIGDRARDVTTALDHLRTTLAGSPRQAAVAAQIRPAVERLLTDLQATHAELRGNRLAAGAAQSAANDRELRAVREQVDELRRNERRLSVQRFERAGQLSSQRRAVLIAGGLATVLFVLLLGWALLRSMLWRLLVVRDNVQRFARDEEPTPQVPARDEIGQIDRAFHEMVRTLRAQRSENEMFIYSVSHDLRSPLVNLQGFSKELARSTRAVHDMLAAEPTGRARDELRRITAQDMPEALHYIDLAVQRQARIIESLLTLSRAGRVEYRWGEVDLDACLRSLVAQVRARAGAEHLAIEVGELPLVHGDRGALERVFDNLLDNAIKYLAPDRPGHIHIDATDTGDGNTIVTVRDNGIGIAAADLPRAFVPFSRFASGAGEGIGLSLVRRVVERHHGRVWLDSEAGVGTTVSVCLPLHPTAVHAATAGDA
jgi:signal transduction histidine kinase